MHSSNRSATQLSCLNGGARLALSHLTGPTLGSILMPIRGSADGVGFALVHALTPSQALRCFRSLAQEHPHLGLPQVHVLGQSRCLGLSQCRNRGLYLNRSRIPLRLTSKKLTLLQIRMADGTVGRLLIGRHVRLRGCANEN